MSSWKLPFLVAAIVVPIVLAFVAAGPAFGVAVGALVAVALVVFAARQRPRDAIGPRESPKGRRVLLVVTEPLEDPGTIERVATAVGRGPAAVMVLAPARIGFLASDVESARRHAQQRLVITVASLAAAGIEAEARVGDEDVVQAVDDQLGSFPASEVILVSAAEEDDEGPAEAARELRERLRADFHWMLSGPAAR